MTGAQWRAAVLSAAATMVAALGGLGTTLLLRQVMTVPTQTSVLVVVLALVLNRSVTRGVRLGAEAVVELVALSVVVSGVAWLLVHVSWLGQALLVLGLSVGIAARRGPGAVRRAGRLVALPFLAILVTPVPVVGGTSTAQLLVWGPAGALVAAMWTIGATRLLPPPPAASEPPARPSRRRVDVPTRMALQMLVGLAAAMVVGRLLFDDRWSWCVLSAFIVASGNRGRGDVAHKALLRVGGAVAGTAAATVGVRHVSPGHVSTLVALFVVMAVALVLRSRSYAFWAAGMTAMLSLLNDYFGSQGMSPSHRLAERLLGVAIGAALGVAAAWLVLPIRTRDVFRGRVADCLRALTDDLAPDAERPQLPDALVRLDQLGPTIRASARGHPRARRQLAAVDALHRLEPPEDPAERRRLRHHVVRVRRSLVGKDDPAAEDLLPELRPVLAALAAP